MFFLSKRINPSCIWSTPSSFLCISLQMHTCAEAVNDPLCRTWLPRALGESLQSLDFIYLIRFANTGNSRCFHRYRCCKLASFSIIFYALSFSPLVQFSRLALSDFLRPHGLEHARLPCPGAYSNSCPLSWWCHPTISSSGIPFSSHLQWFPASGSFHFHWIYSIKRMESSTPDKKLH